MCFWKQVHTNGLCTPGSLAGSGCSYNNRQQSSDEEYGNLRWQIDFHLVCSSCFNMRCSKEKQARVKYVLVWSNKSCILGLTLAKLPSCKSNTKTSIYPSLHLQLIPCGRECWCLSQRSKAGSSRHGGVHPPLSHSHPRVSVQDGIKFGTSFQWGACANRCTAIPQACATLQVNTRRGDLKADFPFKWSAASCCECWIVAVSSQLCDCE